MGLERDDIVANASSVPGTSSLGSLAAYLQRSCGHVRLDEHVALRGYRFYAWMSDEIPHFFNKRFACGKSRIAVTLQAGLDLEGEDPFENCDTHAEALAIIERNNHAESVWTASVTMGSTLYSVADVADALFIAKHPAEFRMIAEELVAVGVLPGSACGLCSAIEYSNHQS